MSERDMDKKPRAKSSRSRKKSEALPPDSSMAKKKMEASRAGFIALKRMEEGKRREPEELAIGNMGSTQPPPIYNPAATKPPSDRYRDKMAKMESSISRGSTEMSFRLTSMESTRSNISRGSSVVDVDVKDFVPVAEEPSDFAGDSNSDFNVHMEPPPTSNPPLWSTLPRLPSQGQQQLPQSKYQAKSARYASDAASVGSSQAGPPDSQAGGAMSSKYHAKMAQYSEAASLSSSNASQPRAMAVGSAGGGGNWRQEAEQQKSGIQNSRYHNKMAAYASNAQGNSKLGFLALFSSRNNNNDGKNKSSRYLQEVQKFDKMVRPSRDVPPSDSQTSMDEKKTRGTNPNRITLRQLEEKRKAGSFRGSASGSCNSSIRSEGLGYRESMEQDPFMVEHEPDPYVRGPGAVYVHDVYGQSDVLSPGHLTQAPQSIAENTSARDLAPPPPASVAHSSSVHDVLLLQNPQAESFYMPEPKQNRICSTRFKLILAGLAIVAGAVCLAIALTRPDSSSDNSSSEEPPMTSTETSSDELEQRRQAVYSFLSTVSDPDLLNQEGSPQHLAMEWVVTEDGLTPIEPALQQVPKKLMQRYALATFFFSTDGVTSWSSSSNWLGGQVDECRWQFLECNVFGEVDAIKTGSTFGNGLKGPLPPEMALLSSIHTLALPSNPITGIPDTLSNLTELVNLDLYSNALTGTIPSVIYELRSLAHLSLGNNILKGTISSSISNLPRLNYLDLSANKDLHGFLPIESLSTALQYLILSSNDLEGHLAELIIRQSNMVYMELFANRFTGSIPSQIGNSKNLEFIHLDNNGISSSIPTEIGLATSLVTILISYTELSGSVPVEVSNLSKLETLQLSFNPLMNGTVPSEVCAVRPPGGSLTALSVPCSVDCTCCNFCK